MSKAAIRVRYRLLRGLRKFWAETAGRLYGVIPDTHPDWRRARNNWLN